MYNAASGCYSAAVKAALPLVFLLLVPPPAAAAGKSSSRDPSAAPGTVQQPSTTEAGQGSAAAELAFARSRMAAANGDWEDAEAELQRAVELAPDDPYVHLEYAKLLLRLGQFGRDAGQRAERLQQAMAQLAAAERAGAGELDTVREIGLAYLDLAQESREAMAAAQRALETVRAARPDDPEVLLPLGQIYRVQGELPKAVAAFREAAAVVPGNGWAQSLLARAVVEMAQQQAKAGKTDEAERLLREGVAANDAEARISLADLVSRRGEHAEAAELLLAVPAEALRPEITQRLVWELFLAGRLDEAAARAQQMPSEGNGTVRTLQILLLAAQGRHDQAADALATVIQKAPSNTTLIEAVTRALASAGRRAEAERFLSSLAQRIEAISGQPGLTAARLELADLASERGAWTEVESRLAPLARTGTTEDGEGWKLLYADALVHLERGAEALAFLPELPADAAVEASRAPLVAKRAEVLLRLGRDAEAARALAALTSKNDPTLLLQAARVYQRLTRYPEAIPLLTRLLDLDGSSVEGRYFLGVALERTGQREEAVSAFRHLISLTPDFAPALNYLGYMWTERGENLEEALRFVERAVALDPNNGAYLDSLGWAFFRLGRFESARGHLERAALLLPEDATVFEHLGDLYVALGSPELARGVYQRALELGSDNPESVRGKLQGVSGGS